MSSNRFLENFKSQNDIKKLNSKDKSKIEEDFYLTLSSCLKNKEFEKFKNLVNYSNELDIFLDVKKIANRYEIFSYHLVNSIQNLSLGEIIDILKFCNQYNLFEKDFTEEENYLLNRSKNDKLFMKNLEDLFGQITNSFIFYVRNDMPLNLYEYFLNYFNFYSFSYDSYNINYILEYFNHYVVYGLSVRLLGNFSDFIKKLNNDISNTNSKYFEFSFNNQRHLVSTKNLKKIMNKFLSKNKEYKFYSLSMVLLGGIGPQGHGFTYITPKGEVVEICSDTRENEAIVIKYRQFLKDQFLFKLEKELCNLSIDLNLKIDIMNYLRESLNPKELINYQKKDTILKKINNILKIQGKVQLNYKDKFKELINEISNTISNIFKEIKMVDQFKTRMDLIDDGKLKSEDIAKLTSLKEKSHYDVLRERFFFQYIVKWFYKIYKAKNTKI
jgi:hypothetical protein